MAEWRRITLYENQIKAEYGASVLIQMPHSSKYDGWVFWFPAKLVRPDHGNYSFSFTDEFTFHLKKYSTGWNRKVTATRDIGVDEMVEAFTNNINNFSREETPLIYTPEKIDPEGATADESLIDD